MHGDEPVAQRQLDAVHHGARLQTLAIVAPIALKALLVVLPVILCDPQWRQTTPCALRYSFSLRSQLCSSGNSRMKSISLISPSWKFLRKVTPLFSYESDTLVIDSKSYTECRLERFFISTACISLSDERKR